MRIKIELLLASVLFIGVLTAQATPTKLSCEYLENPIGVDVNSPRLRWQLDNTERGVVQTSYQIVVGVDSVAVAGGRGTVWDSGIVESSQMLVSFGGELEPCTKYFWRVRTWDSSGGQAWSSVKSFETGLRGMQNWKGSWISDGNSEEGKSIDAKPAGYFRKTFDAPRKIVSARAYIAAAGLYELYVNGERIGDHRLDPMYTRFDRRNLYVSYDVTKQLSQGENCIGVLLGNGWYNHQSVAVWYFDKASWRARPTFCMDVRITYSDGSTQTIVTDRTWKTSTGSVTSNNIYTAEHHDNRLEQQGWSTAKFDDSKWGGVWNRSAPSQNIVSQQLHPIRNVEKITPKSIRVVNDTTRIFDLGRNIAGVVEMNVSGPAGTVIRLKHAERLNKDGSLDQSNIAVFYRPTDDTDPFFTDIFTLSGKGEESFMPKFNYKGFQYVEVTTSVPLALTTDNLCGWFMHSDVPQIGTLKTSNPTINKIWEATNNSYLSNLFGYPTDCPQREKNGWTGDAHIAIETALYNFDAITVYEKWLEDHLDEQQPNGVLPAIIPTDGWGYEWGNGPDWTSTIAIIPWNIYLFYGDSRLLERCYDGMKRYVDHITELAPTGLTQWGLGDWIPVKSKTPVEFTSSVYYYVDADIVAKAAQLLGKTQDAQQYKALSVKIRNAINAKYLNTQTAIYGQGVQTELAVPLFWGVVPEELRGQVAANLAKRVVADNNHLDVGLLGTKAILNALSENGYADLAYKVAAQETFPSWGWWIVNGATTLYENWPIDSGTDISLNHIMFGEIGAWFSKTLGGIKPDPQNPGFKNTLLSPCFVEDLNFSQVDYQSPYGKIAVQWNRVKKGVILQVEIPANASARLTIPMGYRLVKATLLPEKKEVKFDGEITLASGKYEFALSK